MGGEGNFPGGQFSFFQWGAIIPRTFHSFVLKRRDKFFACEHSKSLPIRVNFQ